MNGFSLPFESRRTRRVAAVTGQVLKVVGIALFAGIDPVASGKTGGSAVRPFKPMPILRDRRAAHAQTDGRKWRGSGAGVVQW